MHSDLLRAVLDGAVDAAQRPVLSKVAPLIRIRHCHSCNILIRIIILITLIMLIISPGRSPGCAAVSASRAFPGEYANFVNSSSGFQA
eukprot:3197049-Amphidinium_carterae.1